MKKIKVFFLLMIFCGILFSESNRKIINASLTAFQISKQLTYTDMDFFVGLGILTEVDREGIDLYIKRKREKIKKRLFCKKARFHPDIKKLKIVKEKIFWFDYKHPGEILELRSFFKYKKGIYFLVCHNSMSGYKNFLYKIEGEYIKKVGETKLSYIKVINGFLYGMRIREPQKLFILDKNFKITKEIKLKEAEYFITDFYKYKRDFYFKKVRFSPEQPAFKSENDKVFFFNGQGKGKTLAEGYIRNQIIMGEENDKIYLTFMFPDTPQYPVYIYSKDGKCKKVVYGYIEEYIWIPRGNWLSNVSPKRNMEIVSISKVFCDWGKIFVILHRNTGGKIGNTRKYLQIISKKGKFLGEKEIKVSGFPVFYDRDEKSFYSVRKKDFSIRKWKLMIRYY